MNKYIINLLLTTATISSALFASKGTPAPSPKPSLNQVLQLHESSEQKKERLFQVRPDPP
jgi:hypothetical protein